MAKKRKTKSAVKKRKPVAKKHKPIVAKVVHIKHHPPKRKGKVPVVHVETVLEVPEVHVKTFTEKFLAWLGTVNRFGAPE